MMDPDQMDNRERSRCRFGARWWALKLVVVILLCVPLLGAVVMYLWNWVMPPIFPGVAEIGFWRALGLLVLCRILFGGFRGRHGGWREKRRLMRARWQAMTPEERERCHARMGRFGRGRDQE